MVCGLLGMCLEGENNIYGQQDYFELTWRVNFKNVALKCWNSSIGLCLGAKKKSMANDMALIGVFNSLQEFPFVK
jgi:hypothetical protein